MIAKIKVFLLEHRHGLMGTIIFHLLLAILFLSMEIHRMEVHKEMEIIFEPADISEPEKQQIEDLRMEEIRNIAQEEVNELLRSIAVNENVQANPDSRENLEDYVDKILEQTRGDYGDRYKARKDENYAEDSIRLAEEMLAKMRDSLESVVFVGKSSVSYNIPNRHKVYLPIPVFKCEFGGKVVVAVVVNRRGRVIKAEVIDSESDYDTCLREVAVDAALRSDFNPDNSAPERQSGTITYNFVKQ